MVKSSSCWLLVLVLATPALAQDALLRAQERARYLQDYKALLEHADATVRLAAVEEALAGDDAQLRSLALETAMGGANERLQTTALRWYVNARSQIVVTFMLPERPSQPQSFIYEKWNGLILKDPKVVAPGDEITFKAQFAQAGQLIRGGMQFSFSHASVGACTLTVRPVSGTALAGQFHCSFGRQASRAGGQEGAVPVRIDLS